MTSEVTLEVDVRCPNCGLENPPSAEWCDCGYVFKENRVNLDVALSSPKVDKLRRDAQIICPHCQTKGGVSTKQTMRKAGVSGGKATAAVLTAGFSILATGLSRKEQLTEARCSNCGSVWHF
jgi:DNA-directed RNA polymerase subunit RPC12/RpoP